MRKAAIERVEAAFIKAERPVFQVGDAVDVGVRIIEGDKERVQVFTGTVISCKGKGAAETFTVRRIVAGEGVERTFPIHSPHVAFVHAGRSGKSRRAKLYYLRKRVGKATRLVERRRGVAAEGEGVEGETPETAGEPGDAKA